MNYKSKIKSFPILSSLRTKILLLLTLFTLLIGVVMTPTILTSVSSQMAGELQAKEELIAHYIADSQTDAIITEDQLLLRMELQDLLRQNQDLKYCFILKSNQEVLAHTFTDGFPLELMKLYEHYDGKNLFAKTINSEWGEIRDIAVPIINGSILRFGFSTGAVERSVKELSELLLFSIVMVLLIVTLLAYFIGNWITAPIEKLTEGVRIAGEGNLKYRIPVKTNDELGFFAETFNKTTERLDLTTVSKEKLDTAQRIAHLGLWEFDLKNNTLYWTDEIYNIFGLDPKKFQPSYEHLLDVIHPDDRKMVDDAYSNSLETKKDYVIKHRLLMNNGTIKWVKEECQITFDDNDEPLVSLGVVIDITKEHEAQEKIEEQNKIIQIQSKIASLGEILKNISHHWRQPLSTISMSVNNIMLSIELQEKLSDEEILGCVENVSKQCKYLSKTIDDFNRFLSSKDEVVKNISLEQTLSKAETLIMDTYQANHIKIIINAESCKVSIKENALIESLINILNNARDAMVDNKIDEEKRFVFIDLRCDSDAVKISIKDSAGGIKEDVIDNIWFLLKKCG